MDTRPPTAELGAVIARAAHPPVRQWRFWAIQAAVILIAGIHLLVDAKSQAESAQFPVGLPVALLIIPVGYAALRYGLAGSAATGVWATLLWIPDLVLPHGEGHIGSDLVELALVDLVAFFVGQRIEAERMAHARFERATAGRLAAEAGYRALFEANVAPILVVDERGRIADTNPAAEALFGELVQGRPWQTVLGDGGPIDTRAGKVLTVPGGRDYRVALCPLPVLGGRTATQVIFEDVTEERRVGRQATRYAQLVVSVEEDQRRKLSRELHDEPLQLFLHLARRLESLGGSSGVPGPVAAGLAQARHQAIDAASRLRVLARDLRPPALDQLGLVAAISSILADIEDEAGLNGDIAVTGDEVRLAPGIELGAFRIVQEALRNTVRHAKAHSVAIALTFGEDALELALSDDGVGFDPAAITAQGRARLGLVGMRERAHLLGGHLEIDARPGAGTRITATLPVSGA
ncbi:MAG: PAS domain-containing sensor histidine kinase [Actinomycetota bacterium]|nr:PAS domain-containing sensor histidine kinase [Actinomycetota bacterium]